MLDNGIWLKRSLTDVIPREDDNRDNIINRCVFYQICRHGSLFYLDVSITD